MSQLLSLSQLREPNAFLNRHLGPDAEEQQAMLASLGLGSRAELIEQTVPPGIRFNRALDLPPALDEAAALARLKGYAGQNQVWTSLIGMGYHATLTPTVILRNVLENPGWYTAYTPYQPEIAQGRLEALLNFQQMTIDLTGLDLANASLLDEATAAAEAMALAKRVSKSSSNLFFVDEHCHPQTISVVRTRAEGFGFELVVGGVDELSGHQVFGALLQYPDTHGEIRDLRPLIDQLHAQQALACVAADLLSLLLLTPPGELGADVVLGSSQRFGVPMGYGGPHAAFFACRDEYKRAMPGRIIGVSKDARGQVALRMALQTREQHIRREKANSNICTAQVLLANIAGFYAVYHGPAGLKRIAQRVHRLTCILAVGLERHGIARVNRHFFDTLTLEVGGSQTAIIETARAQQINLRILGRGRLGLSLDETCDESTVARLFDVFLGADHGLDVSSLDAEALESGIPDPLLRRTRYLTHPVFSAHHSETEMLRYLKQLENKDLALNQSMIPLGSCTMKLNASSEMIPITWPEFANLHPFAPREQAAGYGLLIAELERWLCAITGFDAICMQPNSGAQGEYAGLLAIRRYHESRRQGGRHVCLIPASAHGTNPASAQMAGMQVVIVECDEAGNVDLEDLKAKAQAAGERLSCLMATYPSTHGVYEEGISQICEVIHSHGGQVYMDGANLNAQVGLARPADIGADVSHMNLHKTFCIPHGGGGPGMGPIGVRAHLAPFVANHPVVPIDGPLPGNGAVSAAPWGSASILPISWMYIALMGPQLADASEVAILAANYLAEQLSGAFPVLYSGRNGRVAHECILDLRPLKAQTGISEEDVAKRLMDYGFHAPTMSFPVPGTLMVEPTESESKAELDRFIEAMLSIRAEIAQVQEGNWPAEDNPLKGAPHTLADITGVWERSYSIEQAVLPTAHTRAHKYWPAVNRVDNVYGDRNLFCACVPLADYR
ncbi:glycine dehydrogenase (decarboxylating) alpha subunit /glycine dehydrogenase (decarboxylating) beta subunit [Pseudomonas sp. NFPP10]|uniref:aminomethyl-transferring glycine dehydrogenase n=1 Tax=unclassified Pseudomonas TaxID=196821 RepID=UPI0008927BD0|nr:MULTISPECIES: aminomethyl-transferring glycine dehydrogenase [unclassified Pseudomonas]SDA29371.1 glycine dehydrogenase (decarboxylating) alpha subunit /glycine dehydrogenase (decarboxylating) beta subunit [Pseudomonas sp. NFPP12]SEM12527.1 glycine dehydrogenase (decarboxylating) alpha subunit /glycine dehydrogenase (decarboxylating) beta subunit [Pseudomonas sp. NFPP10]SFJ91263.1 glycine dehydrogenase (decarboxylating) alpha subunit /glycine dehydrogenase (decarboxylating) beta subunit [Pseu